MADDVAMCTDQPCGGSADPVTLGLAISALVGLAIATMWER